MNKIDKAMGRYGNKIFMYAYLYAQMREGVIPDVYVQDPKYFDKYSEEIKRVFGEGIGFLEFVSIHIRRGDYVNNPFYVDLTQTDYYTKAVEMFPNKKFLVFSDDREFAKECFNGSDFQVMEGTEEEDFNMMASCESNIIANSSFSYWAAYLNPNPAKKVVCPSPKNLWYNDKIVRTQVPEEWIQIES